MTTDTEDSQFKKQQKVGLLYALLRKKENRYKKEVCFRQIIRDYETDMKILEARIGKIGGVWRIYETLNKRDVVKGRKELMKRLIDNDGEMDDRIDTLWKTCLVQPKNRAERNLLLDLDSDDDDLFQRLKTILDDHNVEYIHHETPNGHHFKCKVFDTRLIQDFPELELKRDDLFFIKTIVVHCKESEHKYMFSEKEDCKICVYCTKKME